MNLGQKVLGKKLFEKLMEMTFYGHFVGKFKYDLYEHKF